MNIIGHKSIFLAISGLLVLASVITIAFFGFQLGIDFTGGTLWQLKFNAPEATREALAEFLESDLGISDAIITAEAETGSLLLRLPEIEQADRNLHLAKIRGKFGEVSELRFDAIGSSIGRELRRRAIIAVIMVLVGISLYIAFAFRKVSRPVSSWKYGLITLLTLFHDVIIPAGLFAVLGRLLGAQVDTNFIVAILVVMGFSVHDTIVVFDRVRENLRHAAAKYDFADLVNTSVNQTFVRSVNTSLTLVLVLIALYFLGSPELRYFVLTMGVGTIVGTYSSIFVASPLLTLWHKKS